MINEENPQKEAFNEWLMRCRVQWYQLDEGVDSVSYQFLFDLLVEDDLIGRLNEF